MYLQMDHVALTGPGWIICSYASMNRAWSFKGILQRNMWELKKKTFSIQQIFIFHPKTYLFTKLKLNFTNFKFYFWYVLKVNWVQS